MGKIRSIGLCIAISAGIVAYLLCTVMGFLPFIQYLWIGFLSMIIYFSVGVHKDAKTYLKMFCSFLCGLAWGQLSNLIYMSVFSANPLAAGLLDNIILVGVMVWVHTALLGNTVFGFLPTAFLGFAETVGFWGRPFPAQGLGMMGSMSTPTGLGYLIVYFLFGLAFAFLVETITDLLARFVLPKQKV